MRLFAVFTFAIVFMACSSGSRPEVRTGPWRGVLAIQGITLPVNLEITRDDSAGYDVLIRNAGEKLLLDEVTFEGDSALFKLHVFDAALKVKVDGDSLRGYYIRNYEKNYRVPFKAGFGATHRFEKTDTTQATTDFSGKYNVVFTNESDTTPAVGIFEQKGNYAQGTFLTTTGDYRYLEGNIIDGKLMLSTFDGNHAYLFTATRVNDSTLAGDYWSGKTYHQAWTATKNAQATLPDAESIVALKPGYDRIEFSFPDVNGNPVSLTDERFKNKVLVLQLLGTWCPNCMDETKFLAPWYTQNRDRGVEVIGLAYERKTDVDYARERIKKMKTKWDVNYELVIAPSTNNKADASKTLPMLTRVAAFPTTIFIGKDGKVKKIHTGFSGPGTGIYYDQFVQHFNETINELLNEPAVPAVQ
jgi:peroxiredoxin